ncbi:MAG: GDSL-type esterase/lipase family protein [Limisphaerales bacterium]
MPAETRSHDRLVVALLLLPALGYLGVMVADVRRLGQIPFSYVDLLFLVLVMGYVMVVAGLRESIHRQRLCLVVYAAAIPILGFEFAGQAMGLRDLPWTPQKKRLRLTAKGLPGMQGEVEFNTTWRGVRSPDVWPERREDRILCVGGSTTECLYVTDAETWPWLLGEKLTDKAGRPVLVGNAGRSGHYTGHHYYQLKHYRYANDYGTVIVLCGINDMATFRRRNLADVQRRVPEEALMLTAQKHSALRGSILVSTLYGIWKTSTVNPRYAIIQDFAAESVNVVKDRRRRYLKKNVIGEMPKGLVGAMENYQRNIRRIANLCRQRQQRVVFVTQPTLYHEKMSEDLDALICEYTDHGSHTTKVLKQLMDAYNDRLLETCRELGVECLDLNAMLPKDTTVFYDDCHFNPSGCKLVAAALFDFLQRN